ncbi:MAG: tyrosine-type recombinase/integrase [Myxococcales bacterium]|nr:tyrosine-type recombinase/integrase [Myxococcales bacterium]
MHARNAKEANEHLVAWRADLESPPGRTGHQERLSAVAEHWLDGKLATIKASTADHYGRVLADYVIPSLGDIFIDALERTDIERWRDEQIGKVRPATINARLRVLKTMLADESDERGLRDAAARVKSVPRIGKGRGPKRTVRETDLPRCPHNRLAPIELAKVLAVLREDAPTWFPMLATMALTGARFGEVSALRWEHVDFASGTIRIEESQWRGIVGSTKTSDVRLLPLEPELAKVLGAHRKKLLCDQHPGLASGLVFPSTVGKPITGAATLRKPLAAAYEKAGIGRWVSPHGFRRSLNNATRQTASGVVVRALTGHVTEEMTEHYSTVEMDEKRAAIRGALGPVLTVLAGDVET